MSDKREMTNAEAVSGQAARRKFLKNSGRLAVAAPAVALLLSAGSKSAIAAADPYGQTVPRWPPT